MSLRTTPSQTRALRRLSWKLLPWMAAAAFSPACIRSQAPQEVPEREGAPTKTSEKPPEDSPWMETSLNGQQRSQLLLEEMTEDEKLTLLFGYYGTDAKWRSHVAPREARTGSAGFVPGIKRLSIPPQWQTDAGVGVATQGSAEKKRARTALPSGLAIAASWDPSLAERGGAMIGAEARASGFNVMLAGGVNLLRDPACGRNFEYGGEDPLLAGVMVGAQIQGIQSNHIISTIKHFAVNDQETDRDHGNSIIGETAARSSDYLAFELAIERSNPGAVMCAYNKVNGDFSCENDYLLTGLLRGQWGYQGFVLSDWGAVHSSAKAANAGLEQQSGFPFDEKPYFREELKKDLSDGRVSKARLNEMAGRILTAMFTHGLFDFPIKESPIDFEKNAVISQRTAEESAVLLKNEGANLPLPLTIKSIAVVGGHADQGVLSGGGSSQVYARGGNAVPGLTPKKWPGPVVYYPSSPLVELRRLAPQAEIHFDSGEDLARSVNVAKGSDVVIVFATQWTTESIDTDISLSDAQEALITAIAAVNARSIVVLQTGGPILMPWANEVSAILQLWYPGTEGGKAIANLLFGLRNPSGHLPMTIARNASQLTHPGPPKAGDVKYKEGATVGYKWFDQKGFDPLFAFGHGLSYSSFSYQALRATPKNEGLSVSFTVTNTSQRPGKTVAQVYVSCEGWEAPKRLGAFQKVTLNAGESTDVTLDVDPRLLSVWDTKNQVWSIRAGQLKVTLASSAKESHQEVTLKLDSKTLTSKSFRH